ncbi:MAG: nucleotidyltransferase family protein, partial [Bulleidia sp.]
MPLRTYQNYETDETRASTMKYAYMMQKPEKYGWVGESHGILTVQQIKDICTDVFSDFDIKYCYLFGSYAKGTASQTGDIDLLISTPVSGKRYSELVEVVREGLKKSDNPELM